MDDNTLMWVWWGFTVAICAWKLCEGMLRPQKMLEWPFLACGMWSYFYGYMAYNAKFNLPEYLGNGISDIGQLMPLLCLIAILVGWHLGTSTTSRIFPETRPYPYLKFYWTGTAFLLVGAAGAYSVSRAIQAGSTNYQEASGYWQLLFYVGYPGLAMSQWALTKLRSNGREGHWFLWSIAWLILAMFMFPHIASARRGPLFPAVMVLLLVPCFARRRPPNRLLFTGILAGVGLVMLLFLQIRHVTYNGGSWSEAVQSLDVSGAVVDKTQNADDNEYINNCQLIGTIYQNGKYQYGTGHMSLLWHWIPRAIWKNKPTLGEGDYSFDELFDDVEAATGFRLLGTGAAAGGVADTFVQYGPLCPLFWFFLSWGMGWVYLRAVAANSPRWLFCYVGFICASHWLVSQGFSAAFVPGVFFQAVPVLVFLALDPSPRAAIAAWARNRSRAVSYPAQAGAVQS